MVPEVEEEEQENGGELNPRFTPNWHLSLLS